jgi:preprotein translocase subunit SecG
MYQFIMIIHVLAAVSVVALVLIQQGKGASMGAAFGSGASQTVFGSRGSGSFLLRLTIGLVVVFFSTSIALNYLAASAMKKQDVIKLPAHAQESTSPVSPASIPMNLPEQPVEKVKK